MDEKYKDLVGKTVAEVQELKTTNGGVVSLIWIFTDGTEVQLTAQAEASFWRED